MRVGVVLPSFTDDARALDAAVQAEGLGLDGVFVFDHLWPLGQPDRPALSSLPLLGAVAAATTSIRIGPLVARVGLLPDRVLIAALRSLDAMAHGRLVCGIGTGDHLSRPENDAFGIPFDRAADRRLALGQVARELRGDGFPVWIGGSSTATNQLAVDLSLAVNLWGTDVAAVSALAPRCEVTWGGPVPKEVPQVARWLADLAGAGASWAVCAWPRSLRAVAEAAGQLH